VDAEADSVSADVVAAARTYVDAVRSGGGEASQVAFWRLVRALGIDEYADALERERSAATSPRRAGAKRSARAIASVLVVVALLLPVAGASVPRCDPPPAGVERLCRSPEVVAWVAIEAASRRHGCPELAEEMYRVLWRESRFDPLAISSSGALGVAQFVRSTWREMVGRMRRAGALREDLIYSPIDPHAAADVMAWAWARGMGYHWRAA
jgi:hypothetical protein